MRRALLYQIQNGVTKRKANDGSEKQGIDGYTIERVGEFCDIVFQLTRKLRITSLLLNTVVFEEVKVCC